jgi:A/G-specific adenine glycosylase
LRSDSRTFVPADLRLFRAALLRWFARHRRPLPWRSTRDPYRVWISEIMLQQTRVGAVREHYAEFLRRFPDVRTLASATRQQVLAAWSGLGYYRRARALHRAARIIMRHRAGELPSSAESLRLLPGIGRYTAAAIASIAFGEPSAVVDGNVERVLRRVLGWPREPRPRLWDVAEQLLSRRAPGNFNQAMMELGAVICLPLRPRCNACPVRGLCATRGPLQRPAQAPRKTAETTYALASRDSCVYLVRRRASESLMPGMWELPQLPNGAPHLPGVGRCGNSGNDNPPEFTLRHSITVTDHIAHVCRISPAGLRGGRWIPIRHAAALPLTGLARRILLRADLI